MYSQRNHPVRFVDASQVQEQLRLTVMIYITITIGRMQENNLKNHNFFTILFAAYVSIVRQRKMAKWQGGKKARTTLPFCSSHINRSKIS